MCDLDAFARGAGELPGVRMHRLDVAVGVRGVVVEHEHPGRVGALHERGEIRDARMPPPHPRRVLLGRVLRVVEEQVDTAGDREPGQRAVRLLAERAVQRRLVVRDEGEAAAVLLDAVTDRRARMRHGRRTHAQAADLPCVPLRPRGTRTGRRACRRRAGSTAARGTRQSGLAGCGRPPRGRRDGSRIPGRAGRRRTRAPRCGRDVSGSAGDGSSSACSATAPARAGGSRCRRRRRAASRPQRVASTHDVLPP